MPFQWEHLGAAEANKSLAITLLRQGHPEWAAVLVFYSALHFVEAYLASKDLHARSHEARWNYISKLTDLQPLYDPYRLLETRSRWARYELRRLSSADVQGFIDSELRQIEERVRALL